MCYFPQNKTKRQTREVESNEYKSENQDKKYQSKNGTMKPVHLDSTRVHTVLLIAVSCKWRKHLIGGYCTFHGMEVLFEHR